MRVRAEVSLREITGDTVRDICRLQVGPGQDRFVAPNAVSIAQAHFEPRAWLRAIYAGEDPVGFIMLYEDPDKPEYFLWRLMIADGRQRKGYGRRALELLVERVRGLPGATGLGTSYVPAEGGPEGFYKGFGFVDTGEVDDGEVVCRLSFGPPA
jgi:diamine N-acetyltransferase